MAINKVVYGSNTLIDLTSDTVAKENVLAGKTFHLKDGTPATGTMADAELTFTTKTASVNIDSLTVSGSHPFYEAQTTKTITGAVMTTVSTEGFADSSSNITYTGDMGLATVKANIAAGDIAGALHTDTTKTSGYDIYRVAPSIAGWLNVNARTVDIDVYQGDYTIS